MKPSPVPENVEPIKMVKVGMPSQRLAGAALLSVVLTVVLLVAIGVFHG